MNLLQRTIQVLSIARTIRLGLLGIVLVALAGCGQSTEPSAGRVNQAKPVIVVSIPPLASLIEPLVSPWGQVHCLLPVGSEPHDFQPTAYQMNAAADAKLLVVVGRRLDDWAVKATRRANGQHVAPPLIRFADALSPASPNTTGSPSDVAASSHDHGSHEDIALSLNPHLWLDPVYCRQLLDYLLPALEKLAPDQTARDHTRQAKAQMDTQLDQLDQTYRSALSQVRRKDLVTFHNAFDLLANRYGLHVAAHLIDIDLASDGQATSDDLIKLIQTIRQLKISVIYSEPQFPDQAVGVIARETGVQVLKLDPLGGPGLPGYNTYFEMMASNLKILQQGQNTP